jgi:hypothetical protein
VAGNEYNLVSHWRVQGTAAEVYDVIVNVEDVTRWWPAAFLQVEPIQPGDENGVNKVVRLKTTGFLPYTLRWVASIASADYPNGFLLHVSGDFNGTGEWRFEEDDGWVNVTFEWNIRVDKPGVAQLSPILKPIFAANHRWAMARGEESLRIELARRRAADAAAAAAIEAPPGPTKLPAAVVAAGLVCGAGLILLSRRRR